MADAERTRSYEWSDPRQVAGAVLEMDGRDAIQAFVDRSLVPPIGATLDFAITGVGDGTAEARFVPQEFHYNPIGSVHGGIAATLLDTVTGCAVHSRLPQGTGYTTLSLTVNYVRGMDTTTGEVRASASVTSLGRRVATAYGELEDAEGRTLATATATCLIVRIG